MKRCLLLVLALTAVSAHVAQAQILEPPMRRMTPTAWTSLSIGWLQMGGVRDPESNATWDFGAAPQWRATLEAPLGRGGGVGFVATTSRLPLIYNGSALGAQTCVSCNAHANVTQLLGLFRMGGGVGFHQVIDINAGYTLFSNFRREDDGSRLGPGGTTNDFTFGLGYGFGYGISERTQVMVVQDYALLIHKRASGSTNNTLQQQSLRFGVRFGLGEKRY